MSEPMDLSEKFPDLRPIKSVPALWTINGVGLSLYGSRDYDQETRTYVKTHCFCVVFIPVVAVGAYRVADADQGWYFIGKVPLSSFAKAWNVALLAAVVLVTGLVWWKSHTGTPEYAAGRRLAEADRLADAGQLGEAARLYREVAVGQTSHAGEALARIQGLLDGSVASAAPSEAAGVFQVAVDLERQRKLTYPKLSERGWELARKNADADPQGAILLLDAIAPVADDKEKLLAFKLSILEKLSAQEPQNVEVASQLAVVYESQKQLEKCEKLLSAHEARLGSSEGARILGQIYVRQGKFEPAYSLLQAYAAERLKRLHAAEQALVQATKEVEGQVLSQLRGGRAAGFNYSRFKQAGKAEQEAMVDQYVAAAFKDSQKIKDAQDAVGREADVVPVALDLGIVMLRRAQAMPAPKERQLELERAEKTFLAVRSLAGGTDEYRLFLGQVYYWLGKQADGKKLFDELLAAHQRNAESLVDVSRVLREVGAWSEARPLAEEAYEKETDASKKARIAYLRALLNVDLDDQIVWLGRSSQSNPMIKASLATAQGHKSLEEGKDAEAAKHFRDAIAIYSQQADNPTVFNDWALTQLGLFSATGEKPDMDRALELFEKALAGQQSSSVVLNNISHTLLESIARDLATPALDLKTLRTGAKLGLLQYLYRDPEGRDQFVERFRKHPARPRLLEYLNRLQVLAPKSPGAYAMLYQIHHFTHDTVQMRALLQRMEENDLDLADASRATLDYYAGKDDEKHGKELVVQISSMTAAYQNAQAKGGPTLSAAAAMLAQQKMRLPEYGRPIDPSEVVALAEESQKAASCRASQRLLIRAGQSIAAQNGEYDALVKKSSRCLGPSYLIAVALGRGGPLRAAVLANKDVQRAIDLERELAGRFLDEPHEWAWAILNSTHPADAAKLAEAIRKDEFCRLDRAIERKFAPCSGAEAYRSCWAYELAGEPAKGADVLKQCAALGVPLP